MLLIKSFFRKVTTKIYFFTFSILLLSAIILFSFLNYYQKLSDDLFKNNTNLIIASEIDYYKDLENNRYVSDINNFLLFYPKINSKIGGVLPWEYFFIGGNGVLDKAVMVFPNNDLKENEIVLGTNLNYIKDKINTANLFGENISILKNKKLIIKAFYDTSLPKIQISEKLFNELHKTEKIKGYQINIDNKNAANRLIKKLEKNKTSDYLMKTKHDSLKSSNNSIVIEKIVNTLTLVCKASILINSLIFIIILRNIINDDKKKSIINMTLGYSKIQTQKIMFTKIIILELITFLFVSILSCILLIILNSLFHFNIVIFDVMLHLKIYLFIVVLSFINCLFLGKINRNIF